MRYNPRLQYFTFFLRAVKRIKAEIYSYMQFVKFHFQSDPLCYIEEIDLEEKTIHIHCRGINSSIKLNFNQIINDSGFLANFSVRQAAWIGYYYGKYYEEMLGDACGNNNHKPIDFSIDAFSDDSNPITLNRFGELVFLDKLKGENRVVSPVNLIRDNRAISQFTPVQACYIGILAGTSSIKNPVSKSTSLSSTKFSVIK